jgi:hypothetical protein
MMMDRALPLGLMRPVLEPFFLFEAQFLGEGEEQDRGVGAPLVVAVVARVDAPRDQPIGIDSQVTGLTQGDIPGCADPHLLRTALPVITQHAGPRAAVLDDHIEVVTIAVRAGRQAVNLLRVELALMMLSPFLLNNSHFREGREFEAPWEILSGQNGRKNGRKPARALRAQPEVQVNGQKSKRVKTDRSDWKGPRRSKKLLGDRGFLYRPWTMEVGGKR